MRKVLKNNKRAKTKLEKLPKVYLIACWAKWGVMEFPFVKFNKDKIPLVYDYDDHNGTADQWELRRIDLTTTGWIYGWTFSKEEADIIAEQQNGRISQ